VYQPPSPATEGPSSHPPCGLHYAPFSISPMCRPPPIILRQTAQWSVFTADLKMLSAPAQLALIGTPICHGSCSASGQPGGATQNFLLQKQFLEPNLSFQANNSPHQNRHRRRSSESCRRPSTTRQRRRRTTTTTLVCSHCRKSAAAALSHVLRSVPGSGKVSTFFQNSGGSQARHRFNSSPETMQVAARCAACRPASPRPTPGGPSRRYSPS
jgi:hypothetical protein